MPHQNCRQKVFNREALRFCTGLDIENLVKIPLIYSVSYFNLGDSVFVWGLNPSNPLRGNGTVSPFNLYDMSIIRRTLLRYFLSRNQDPYFAETNSNNFFTQLPILRCRHDLQPPLFRYQADSLFDAL